MPPKKPVSTLPASKQEPTLSGVAISITGDFSSAPPKAILIESTSFSSPNAQRRRREEKEYLSMFLFLALPVSPYKRAKKRAIYSSRNF